MGKKKKRSLLKPLIMLLISALMVGCYFIPFAGSKVEALGLSTEITHISGLDATAALFSEDGSGLKGGASVAYALKEGSATAGPMKVGTIAFLVLGILGALGIAASLYAVFTRKKMPMGGLFACLYAVLGIVTLVCSIMVVANAGKIDFGILGSLKLGTFSIGAASILTTIFGLGSTAAHALLKK